MYNTKTYKRMYAYPLEGKETKIKNEREITKDQILYGTI